MRKPITAIILSLIVGMLMLAGCQQEDAAQEEGPVTLKLARFFGDCDDTTKGVTDVSKATTECEVIQILTNKFNAENEGGIVIERLGGAEWGTYYDALNTSFAGGDPPDVAVVHGSNLPDYADRGLLMPLDDLYAEAGIDVSDWTEPAQNAVKYDGVGYGVAFDLHASLDHVNVDIFKEAGLVDANGDPIRPTSPEEFMAQAEKVKETTGAYYFVTDASQFPFSARLLVTLVYQQGSSLISEDGNSANVDTPEARRAVEFMLELFEKGYANPDHNYTAAQEAFLDGNAAIMNNGTWAVDQYNREADFEYRAMDRATIFGSPAVWANSHMWILPKKEDGNYEAGMKFLKFLYDNSFAWTAGTGHLAPRTSVLEGEELKSIPQRNNYAHTADIAMLVPSILNWQAVEDILKEEIEATWLTGKDVGKALEDADRRINEVLQR